MIRGIVAVDDFDNIGFDNDLLFRSKADMEHFKKTTMGHIVVMGRRTFDSIGRKPLDGRLNIVLSSELEKEAYGLDNLIVCNDWKEFIRLIAKYDREDGRDIFVMGGGRMYVSMEEYIDEWVVTIFDKTAPEADTYLEVDFQPFRKVRTEMLEEGVKVVYYERD